jgi:hypothetical protein
LISLSNWASMQNSESRSRRTFRSERSIPLHHSRRHIPITRVNDRPLGNGAQG